MAEVKWIKLMVDMFDNSKIKYIRTLPEGNNIVLIWVMLLAKAGKCNSNGYIFLTENIPYTPDMLASEFGFEINTIHLALGVLSKLNMIQRSEEKIEVSNWGEYQNLEGMDKIREQNRLRKQKQREREKLLAAENCHVTSRDCHATERRKKKEEIEKEKNIKKEKADEEVKTSTLTKKFIPPTVEEVREYCNERNNNVNPQAFIDFYESKGWMIGKNKMKNWKAAVRTRERKDQGNTVKKQSTFTAHI